MDDTALLKAWAQLQAFPDNLPVGDIEENYVTDYHHILHAIEALTGHALREFLIPDDALQYQIRSWTSDPPRLVPNRFRSCARGIFLMKLDAAITFFNSVIASRKQIGF